MTIKSFENGITIVTGNDIYDFLMKGFDKRNNYEKSCHYCRHNEDDDYCSDCSIKDDLSCSCHINPPCTKCTNSKFEPTEYLINFKVFSNGKFKWECFPSTKEIYKKYQEIESNGFELSCEILNNKLILYIDNNLEQTEQDDIEITEQKYLKPKFTEMIIRFNERKEGK